MSWSSLGTLLFPILKSRMIPSTLSLFLLQAQSCFIHQAYCSQKTLPSCESLAYTAIPSFLEASL